MPKISAKKQQIFFKTYCFPYRCVAVVIQFLGLFVKPKFEQCGN